MNSKQRKEKDARLRREYQITLEERQLVFEYQNKCCAICGKPEASMKISLSVDHAHKDGLLRGLLCLRCNKALELLNNNPVVCFNAGKYLTNPPFVVVLGERYTAIGKVGTKIRRKRLAKLKEENGQKEKAKKKDNHKSSKKQKSV